MVNSETIRSSCLSLACLCVLASGCATTASGPWGKTASNWAKQRPGANRPKPNGASPKLNLNYAKWQEQLGNLAEAREKYQLVLRDEPKSCEAILGLARLDQLSDQVAAAEQGYLKALKLKPNNPAVLQAAGQFYASQERWPMAVKLLESAMQAAPSDKTVRFHLAVAKTNAGDVDGARPHFIKAVGEPQAEYNIGLLLHRQGRDEESEKHFLQAVLKKPDFPQAQYWLDEVRRERETKLMLASAPPTATNGQDVVSRESDAVQGRAAQTHVPRPTSLQSNAVSGAQPPAGPIQPVTSLNGNQTAVPIPSIQTRQPKPTRSPLAGLTPIQLEQLRNQKTLGTPSANP